LKGESLISFGASQMPLLDWDQFLERVERNECLALELAEDLLLGIDGRVSKLSDAIGSMLPKAVEQAAHALRGLVSPYGGRELLAELKRMEETARSGVILYASLPLEINRLVTGLKSELSMKLAEAKGQSHGKISGSDRL
jgi:hypothetical protein